MTKLRLYKGTESVLVSLNSMKSLISALESVGALEEIDRTIDNDKMRIEVSVDFVNSVKSFLYESVTRKPLTDPGLIADIDIGAAKDVMECAHCPRRPEPRPRPEPKPTPTPPKKKIGPGMPGKRGL